MPTMCLVLAWWLEKTDENKPYSGSADIEFGEQRGGRTFVREPCWHVSHCLRDKNEMELETLSLLQSRAGRQGEPIEVRKQG